MRKENRQQATTIQELNQQISAAERTLWRKLKEREDVLNQMSADIDHLKQERDTYKDRFQRSLRDAQTQREQLERAMSSASTLSIMQNVRAMGSLSIAGGFAAQNSDGAGVGGSGMHGQSQQLNSASNQQEINLQKEITEMRNRYEKQLRDQRHELVLRTRDLQKVERKNIKYRENNRVLGDAVRGLENRNLSAAAGSGGANQADVLVMYEHALRETSGDLIENMDYTDGDDTNQWFDSHQQDEVIAGRNL